MAIASGVGVAIGVMQGGVSTLVGIAVCLEMFSLPLSFSLYLSLSLRPNNTVTHKTQLQISAALLPPVVNCGLCFALHFNVNANAQKFEPDYFLHISLYSGGLFILNIVCIVICANLTFVMKKVNFANSVVITKTKERRRSESSITASLMNDDVSTMYMNPPSKTTNSSSMMDNLLCRVQNDDLVTLSCDEINHDRHHQQECI